jgi:hypothetical protein
VRFAANVFNKGIRYGVVVIEDVENLEAQVSGIKHTEGIFRIRYGCTVDELPG